MDLAAWFSRQLMNSAEGFIWAFEQMPTERLWAVPRSPYLGAWPAARHASHMLNYERLLVIPAMRWWLGDAPVSAQHMERWEASENHWSPPDLETVLADFRQARDEQLALIAEVPEPLWDTLRSSLWGEVTLKWLVSKTFQHTAEHTSTVMQIVLFWDKLEK